MQLGRESHARAAPKPDDAVAVQGLCHHDLGDQRGETAYPHTESAVLVIELLDQQRVKVQGEYPEALGTVEQRHPRSVGHRAVARTVS